MKNPRAIGLIILAGFFATLGATGTFAAEVKVPSAAEAEAGKKPALLLANVWDPSIDPTGWWVSEKYDGIRCYWDGQKLWTRAGNAIVAPAYFLAELPPNIALDGELWIGRGKFEETVGTVRAQTPGDGWKKVSFMVFDAPAASGTFKDRMKFLQTTLTKKDSSVKIVAQVRCRDAAHLLAERDRVVAEGAEGLMLRKPESEYDPRRSPTLLKVKPWDDAEATVIGHLPGKGRLAKKLGALQVRTADGREFALGTGFSDAQRDTPPPVGTVVTYRFRGLTDNGMPRFASFLRVRKD